jgi:hypothetical protein
MSALNDGRDKDPEEDTADAGELKTPTCAYCGGPLDADGLCVNQWCPDNPDALEDEDFEEGLLGEDDEDA